MKILIITPSCHYKSVGAVQKDIYSTIDLLKEIGYEVLLYTIDQPGQDLSLIGEWQKFSPQNNFLLWLKAAIINWPLFDRSAYIFYQLSKDKTFVEFFNQVKPDIIFSYGNYSWPVSAAAVKIGAKFIIRSHNYEPLHFWEELSTIKKIDPLNWFRFLAKLLSEKKSIKVADAIAAISPNEEKKYKKWGREKIVLLPLVSLYKNISAPHVSKNKETLNIFYMGASYNVPFHRWGAEVLIKKIAPKVEDLMPGKFRFYILGSKLPFVNLASNITYMGFVPESEMSKFLYQMDIGAFPVFSGQGMKQKIFESICRAYPVIAPRVSLGGYTLEDKKHFIEAHSIDDFVNGIFSLNDIKLRKELSIGASLFANANFSKEKFINIFSQLCKGKKH